MSHGQVERLRHVPIERLDARAAQLFEQQSAFKTEDARRLLDFLARDEVRRLEQDGVGADRHHLITTRPRMNEHAQVIRGQQGERQNAEEQKDVVDWSK